MRMHVLPLGIMIVLLSTGAPASAQAKDLKIGYINIQRIVTEVNEAKNARTKLQKDFELKQKKLDDMKTDFEKAMENFDKQKDMMKPEVRAKTESDLKDKYTNLQQTLMKLQSDLADSEGRMAQEIHGKIRKIVEAVGDRDGYDLILDNSEIKSSVLYFKRHLDITDSIITAYNAQNKG